MRAPNIATQCKLSCRTRATLAEFNPSLKFPSETITFVQQYNVAAQFYPGEVLSAKGPTSLCVE